MILHGLTPGDGRVTIRGFSAKFSIRGRCLKRDGEVDRGIYESSSISGAVSRVTLAAW